MFGFTKSPAFQFLINPSTIFIISGMLVAKYRDDPVQEVHTPKTEFMNSTMPFTFANPLYEENAPTKLANSTNLDRYYLQDSITALEMHLISLIIQGHDNSTQWQFKFVDLPPTNLDKSFVQTSYQPSSYYSPPLPEHIQRKANVLITDAQELVPIWVVVNLSQGKVESWSRGKHGGSRSSSAEKVSKEERLVAGEIALADVKVQQRIQAFEHYGDIYDVVPDIWDAGFISQNPQEKLAQVYFYGMRMEDREPFAFPFDFVVYVDLGKNVVRAIEDLPLHYQTNPKKMSTTNTSVFYPAVPLSPNTLSQFHARSSFEISGTEELQR